jgi:hypothetical protein
MIRKSGNRFSAQIMLEQKDEIIGNHRAGKGAAIKL